VVVSRIVYSRLKKDVLSQLPSKFRTVVVLDPSSVAIDRAMAASHTLVNRMKVLYAGIYEEIIDTSSNIATTSCS